MTETILAKIDEVWRTYDGVVSDVDGRWDTPLDSDDPLEARTVADAVVHVAAWKRNAAEVALMLKENPETPDGFPAQVLGLDQDGFNSELLKVWTGKGEDEILREHRDAHEELVSAIAGLPQEAFVDPESGKLRRWLTPAIWHTRHHGDEVRQALGL